MNCKISAAAPGKETPAKWAEEPWPGKQPSVPGSAGGDSDRFGRSDPALVRGPPPIPDLSTHTMMRSVLATTLGGGGGALRTPISQMMKLSLQARQELV